MSSLIPDLRVGVYHAFDFNFLVIVKPEATLITTGLACLKAGSAAKEGNKADCGQNYCFTMLTKEEKQGEGDKPNKDEG
jgi:hypothetical protein